MILSYESEQMLHHELRVYQLITRYNEPGSHQVLAPYNELEFLLFFVQVLFLSCYISLFLQEKDGFIPGYFNYGIMGCTPLLYPVLRGSIVD